MKKLGLIYHLYKKSILNLLLITAVMIVACFSILYTAGRVNYIKQTKRIFTKLISDDSYCIQFGNFSEYNTKDISLYIEAYQELMQELKNNTKLENIDAIQHTDTLECNGKRAVVFLYSDSLWTKFLNYLKTDTPTGSDTEHFPFGILSGPNFKDTKAGEVLALHSQFENSKAETPKFYALSHTRHPYYIPTFLTAGNILSTNDFISQGNFIILRETAETLAQLKKITPIYPTAAFFITFREDISPSEKAAILQDLENRFSAESASTIQKNTDIKIKQNLSKALPLPIFAVTVSTASFLSLSALLLHRKEKELAIYYLCGNSKRKNFLLTLYVLGIPAFLSAFFNVLFLLLYPTLSSKKAIDFYGILFDNTSVILVLLYLVGMIIICASLSLSRSTKRSEIEVFRRN